MGNCSCGNRAKFKGLWPGQRPMYACGRCWRIVLGSLRRIAGR
jgi:hypothetical protein